MTVVWEKTLPVKTAVQEQDWSHVRGYGWRPQLSDARDKVYAPRLKSVPRGDAVVGGHAVSP